MSDAASTGDKHPHSSTSEILKIAKDFSFDQKISVVQSILSSIPRERQAPWNNQRVKKNSNFASKQITQTGVTPTVETETTLLSSRLEKNISRDGTTANESFNEQLDKRQVTEKFSLVGESISTCLQTQQPPLVDPYEKSMKYYEKHMILNNFQHMTAKLALRRPEDALQFMIDWCKQMQIRQADQQLKSKALYEDNKIDVYDEDGGEAEQISKNAIPSGAKSEAESGLKSETQSITKNETELVVTTSKDKDDSGLGGAMSSMLSDKHTSQEMWSDKKSQDTSTSESNFLPTS
ncbi:hypothetical protein EB796_005592 [Bugula neritina]|uniref:Uncharacterized protein n=1 Tax=Bugula neritina TaxID=10212 RepID=A0A7J7KD37_BUGNE|nr:hypothetical protein EB796_005592 [Bugula neritina]